MTIIDSYNKITGLSVGDYISSYNSFVSTNLGKIVNYYIGVEEKPDIISFKLLNSLLKESNSYDEASLIHCNRFDNAEYWDLIELLDDIRTSLNTANNTYKWVRSTVANGDFNTDPEANVVLGQLSTIESLANSAGYKDPNNSWVKIAIRNDLDEDKYTTAGGNVLKINVLSGTGLVISDVIDQVFGENMKGKDILAKFTFHNNDLAVVSGDACLFQSYSSLLTLRKGDIPEFPYLGIGVIIGGNMAAFSYPTILRQVHSTFYTDSSVKSVGISKFNTDGDNIELDFQIASKFGDILQNGTIL